MTKEKSHRCLGTEQTGNGQDRRRFIEPVYHWSCPATLPSRNDRIDLAARSGAASAEELGLLREQRAALDLQKRGLMQQLLTGKVRVRP